MSLIFYLIHNPVQLFVGILVGLLTLISYHVYKLYSNRKNYPPGPFPLPFIGNILYFKGKNRHVHHLFEDLANEYGPIYTFHFGHRPHVIVVDKSLALEVLSKHQFAGRPRIPIFDELFKAGSVDISTSDFNYEWEVLRKVSHSAMRKYAVSDRFSTVVADVVDQVVAQIKSSNQKDINLAYWFDRTLHSIFATSAFGRRFALDDPDLMSWMEAFRVQIEQSSQILLFGFIPWLKYVYLKRYREFKEAVTFQQNFMEKRYQEHVDTFDGSTIRDFTDAMLMAKKEAEAEGLEHTAEYLRPWNIMNSVNTLFSGGNESSHTTLRWMFLFLTSYPEIQKKIRAEVVKLIGGPEVIPTTDHRSRCHYTAAFIAEILRFRHVFPVNAIHKATIDMDLGGHRIKEGTAIQALLSPALMDKEIWGDTEVFRPERFLGSDGVFTPRPNQFYYPFSAGRRTCPGDKLALFNLFFILVRFIQRTEGFEFVLNGGPGSIDLNGDPSNPRGMHPFEYTVYLKPLDS